MPQDYQIVPAYQQPYVETHINDNTITAVETANAVDTNVKFLAVFRSGQGKDNVIIKKTLLTDFTKTYGNSDYAKYGQPLMMPIAMLGAGNASVYCMRIMPADAAYANAVISALYKKDATSGKMIIKYVSDTVASGNTATEIELAAEALATTDPDTDGFVKLPIAVIRVDGRGVYGNKFRFRIVNNQDYEKEYGIKMFTFQALSAAAGLQSIDTSYGSIITSPKYNQTTLINDVMDEAEVGAKPLNVKVFEENVQSLYDEFVAFVGGLAEASRGTIPDVDAFDPFFGLGVASATAHKNIQIVTTGTGVISLDNPEGNVLSNGSDGSFAASTQEAIDAAVTATYIMAFEGKLDAHILSPVRVPATVLLDANYPYDVKAAFAAMCHKRESAVAYLDAGIITSVAEIDNIITDYAAFNTRDLSKEFQHYYVRDNVTKKKVPVTTTYYIAQNIANHIVTKGNHVPFVKENATLTGHIKNSLEPAIELLDMELKEKLYTNRFNYWECVDENVFVRSVQNTAQNVTSDLLEENNMHVLYELKGIIEKDTRANLYNFANADDRNRFTEFEKAKFANWVGRKVATFDVFFTMNQWEAERSILHCYIAATFRTLNKRTIVEIDINKRDFTA